MRGSLRWLLILAWAGMVVAFPAGMAGAALLWSVAQTVPDGRSIVSYRPPVKSVILSSDGRVIASLYEENREWAPLTTIPKRLQDASIAIEDHRFYSHGAIDPVGTLRALWANVTSRRVAQGGSSITQQLARAVYLDNRRTLLRKLREAILARRIERHISKRRILELYLNQVYYGSGAYGVRAAAKAYFGKRLRELTLAECALIAGLPARPSALSPFRDPDAARARRDVVLDRMSEVRLISREQAAAVKKEPIRLHPRADSRRLKRAPYFVDWALPWLVQQFGEERVYGDGLVIHASINLGAQLAAEEAVRQGLALGQTRGRVTQAALVAIDPRTGHIKAMVGGRDHGESQFNRAVNATGRQPGSAFKPFVYTTALESGYQPETILDDSPVAVPDNGKVWSPGNYDDEFRGPVTLREALINSINVPAIRVAMAVGPQRVVERARALGITSALRAVPSVAIGTSEVTPLELTAAYAAFANGGHRVAPLAILRVEDRDGHVLWRAEPRLERVIAPDIAATMAMLLRDVVLYGTGRSVSGVPNAAGKTGTTQDDRDAWFVGFTPELVTGVWVGNDDHSPMGGRVFGGNVPGPIWAAFTREAVALVRQSGDAVAGREIPSYQAYQEARAAAERRRREAQGEPPPDARVPGREMDHWSGRVPGG
ncbi:MAG: penicillin-binding protein 1A [Armatimonadetes bacterium]|nr:penicillin-binding protein 1A [Armatimonadota bacterium]